MHKVRRWGSMKKLLFVIVGFLLFGWVCNSWNDTVLKVDSDTSDTSYTWEVAYFMDNFDEPTSEKYIRQHSSDGIYSVSKLREPNLYAKTSVYVSDKTGKLSVQFIFFRLLRNRVQSNEGVYYTLEAKTDNKKVYTFEAAEIFGEFAIIRGGIDEFIKLLKNNKTLSIYLKADGDYSDTFNFKINCMGFKSAVAKL